MSMIKATFTLDERTVRRLEQAAARLQKPKSEIVREAIDDFHQRVGRVSESERLRLLRLFDEVVPAIPSRPRAETKRELARVRDARRAGRGGARGRQ